MYDVDVHKRYKSDGEDAYIIIFPEEKLSISKGLVSGNVTVNGLYIGNVLDILINRIRVSGESHDEGGNFLSTHYLDRLDEKGVVALLEYTKLPVQERTIERTEEVKRAIDSLVMSTKQ